ncbi:gamma-glutamylcyclotransferase family protein [Hoeflea poritis]|uniref:Gamma-glutamylcyclotransferase n=1 Tax=Hoeflea poritis TaxID=2993659 RepID=A0ABT4VKI7_9HYPH|nr:gamma-glutamylcyclotransferase family protein [Hoeflea poritis]MDA4845237.1 gamma-glutamylcyclotransferase [Hoeflea poritis]
MKTYYFAYGSNMDQVEFYRRLNRDREREFLRWSGVLPDFTLRFAKRSSLNPRVGYATVDAEAGQQVEGVVYEVSVAELATLDRIELVPDHYIRLPQTVVISAIGKSVLAECYFATPAWRESGLLPTQAYIARMQNAGALISDEYARALAAHATIEQEENAPVA